jgi:hypothetical protein
MQVSTRFYGSSSLPPPLVATQDALALLQQEMERRFAETLFGAETLSAEEENAIAAQRPVLAEIKITALWELRTSFGPRGSPPKSFAELPAEVRANLFSVSGACPDAGYEPWAARTCSSAAGRKRVALHLTTLLEAGT